MYFDITGPKTPPMRLKQLDSLDHPHWPMKKNPMIVKVQGTHFSFLFSKNVKLTLIEVTKLPIGRPSQEIILMSSQVDHVV